MTIEPVEIGNVGRGSGGNRKSRFARLNKNMPKIEVELAEVWALIDYWKTLVNRFPESLLDSYNIMGTTYREVRDKYQARVDELEKLVEENWPK